jgi:hypothetical protein
VEQKDLTAFRRPFIRAHHTRFEISWDHLIGQPISADVHRASSYDTSTFSYEPNVFNVVLSTKTEIISLESGSLLKCTAVCDLFSVTNCTKVNFLIWVPFSKILKIQKLKKMTKIEK